MATQTFPTNKQVWDAEQAEAKALVDDLAASRKASWDAVVAELAKVLPQPVVPAGGGGGTGSPAPKPDPVQADDTDDDA